MVVRQNSIEKITENWRKRNSTPYNSRIPIINANDENRKSPFGKHPTNDDLKQELPMAPKLVGEMKVRKRMVA